MIKPGKAKKKKKKSKIKKKKFTTLFDLDVAIIVIRCVIDIVSERDCLSVSQFFCVPNDFHLGRGLWNVRKVRWLFRRNGDISRGDDYERKIGVEGSSVWEIDVRGRDRSRSFENAE